MSYDLFKDHRLFIMDNASCFLQKNGRKVHVRPAGKSKKLLLVARSTLKASVGGVINIKSCC